MTEPQPEFDELEFIAGITLGAIMMALLIVATAYLFGCHVALGDLCTVVRP